MNNPAAVSGDPAEMTRKTGERIQSEILRRLADVKQTVAADRMGVSESTVSRLHEDIAKVSQLLAAVELKVADADSMVVDRSELDALESMAFKYLELRRRLKRKDDGEIDL